MAEQAANLGALSCEMDGKLSLSNRQVAFEYWI